MNKAKEVRVKKLESLKIRQDATVFESSEYKRIQRMVNTLISVSYTHLTLPTIYSV